MNIRTVFPIVVLATALVLHSISPPLVLGQADRRGLAFRLVPGVALAGASFGDDSPESSTSAAFQVGAQFWAPASRVLGLNLEAMYQPTSISNPHEFIDESFTVFYLMLGAEFAIGSAYLRPNLGLAFLSFSGIGDNSTQPAIGLAVGTERPFGGMWHISPEIVGRLSFESGLVNYMLGLQLPIGIRPEAAKADDRLRRASS